MVHVYAIAKVRVASPVLSHFEVSAKAGFFLKCCVLCNCEDSSCHGNSITVCVLVVHVQFRIVLSLIPTRPACVFSQLSLVGLLKGIHSEGVLNRTIFTEAQIGWH